MKLKKSDIICAQLMPAFSDVIRASALRITDHGYFDYLTSVWEENSGEFRFEGHLSDEHLTEVKALIAGLACDYSPSTWIDDVGSRELGIHDGRRTRVFRLLGQGGESYPSEEERKIDDVWLAVHSIVETAIRAEQVAASDR